MLDGLLGASVALIIALIAMFVSPRHQSVVTGAQFKAGCLHVFESTRSGARETLRLYVSRVYGVNGKLFSRSAPSPQAVLRASRLGDMSNLFDESLGTQAIVAFGWPWPALCYLESCDPLGACRYKNALHIGGHQIATRPLVGGLLLNSALFMTVIALMHSGILRLRRRSRWARGACGGCGYPLRSLTCTECGMDQASRRVHQ